MTDREVPQGNQDGVSCPFCNGTASATGIRPQPCHSCGGAGVITAASSGSEPSTASENASGSGSQDSIDTLDEILDYYCWTLDLTKEENRYHIADIKEVILAWHNTQLKAEMKMLEAIMNKRLDDAGIDNFSARTYLEEAIDDMQANLEKL